MQKKNDFIISLSVVVLLLVSFVLFKPGETKISKNINSSIPEEFGCVYHDLSGVIDYSQTTAYFEGKEISIPRYAYVDNVDNEVLGLASEEKWIEVDLSDQKLYAWQGDQLFMESLISSGLPWYPTPTGEFRVWIKLRATKMEGGTGAYYYYLPNVPHVMYFENSSVPGWRGYGIHGAYWHNDFGNPHSHGCVNLPLDAAETLYYWASPVIPEGKTSIRSTPENPGIRIVIHE